MSPLAGVALAIFAVAALIVLLVRRLRPRGAAAGEVVRGLRLRILQEDWQTLDASAAPNQPLVAMMELGYPTATATIFGTSQGEASLYISTGGGVLGGGGHENVRAAAKAFVRQSAAHLPHLTATSELPYPENGHVRFYVRTPKQVYTAERADAELASGRDPLSPLFMAGHNLIAQLRTVTPQ